MKKKTLSLSVIIAMAFCIGTVLKTSSNTNNSKQNNLGIEEHVESKMKPNGFLNITTSSVFVDLGNYQTGVNIADDKESWFGNSFKYISDYNEGYPFIDFDNTSAISDSGDAYVFNINNSEFEYGGEYVDVPSMNKYIYNNSQVYFLESNVEFSTCFSNNTSLIFSLTEGDEDAGIASSVNVYSSLVINWAYLGSNFNNCLFKFSLFGYDTTTGESKYTDEELIESSSTTFYYYDEYGEITEGTDYLNNMHFAATTVSLPNDIAIAGIKFHNFEESNDSCIAIDYFTLSCYGLNEAVINPNIEEQFVSTDDIYPIGDFYYFAQGVDSPIDFTQDPYSYLVDESCGFNISGDSTVSSTYELMDYEYVRALLILRICNPSSPEESAIHYCVVNVPSSMINSIVSFVKTRAFSEMSRFPNSYGDATFGYTDTNGLVHFNKLHTCSFDVSGTSESEDETYIPSDTYNPIMLDARIANNTSNYSAWVLSSHCNYNYSTSNTDSPCVGFRIKHDDKITEGIFYSQKNGNTITMNDDYNPDNIDNFERSTNSKYRWDIDYVLVDDHYETVLYSANTSLDKRYYLMADDVNHVFALRDSPFETNQFRRVEFFISSADGGESENSQISFLETVFMHAADFNHISAAQGCGLCKSTSTSIGYYEKAKIAFTKDFIYLIFGELGHSSLNRARLQAWAAANGESLSEENGVYSFNTNQRSFSFLGDSQESYLPLIIIIASSLLLLSSGAALILIKKRKNINN